MHSRYLFPRWSNRLPGQIAVGLGVVTVGVVAAFWYWGTDKFLSVGYSPKQPVPFSHKLHAGDLGLDCRYCHSTVERAPMAAVPPTQTCMNCHAKVKTESAKLSLVRQSFASEQPIPWVRVHELPDYVYFDHSAHLAAGVGCSSCHGRVDQMAQVVQKAPLTMGWCLECHRDAGKQLRRASEITQMDWQPKNESPQPAITANGREAHPPTHCSGCHR